MKKIFSELITILLLFSYVHSIRAQQPIVPIKKQTTEIGNPFLIYQKGLQENNYLTPLIEFQRNEAEYMKSEQWSGLLPDLLAYLYSFVGKYDAAYIYLDKNIEKQLKPQPDLQSAAFDNYEQRDALEAIASAANKHQVIMINEEHDTPMHRAFTARLLPVLYKKGFRYLAAETLNDTDTELNSRGYPTHETGFYSNDPIFGDMIRTALKLGFKLVSYEHRPKERCVSPADKPMFCQNERERGQAQNLYDNIFKADPKAKVLVHVGRGHNQKVKLDDWAQMGWHFKEISKIDAFSVNQMNSERSAVRYERPEYRYVTSKWKFTEPTAFQSKTGEWWKGNGYDLHIYHPRTRYERGRPEWLKTGGRRKAVKINLKRLNIQAQNKQFDGTEPILVQAFQTNESADAIPVDQIILYPNKQISVLMLPKGKFRIRAMDKTGEITGQYEVKWK